MIPPIVRFPGRPFSLYFLESIENRAREFLLVTSVPTGFQVRCPVCPAMQIVQAWTPVVLQHDAGCAYMFRIEKATDAWLN